MGTGTVETGTAGAGDDRLIGRDREIEQLLARLATGEPGLVVIEGAASIGKGRLLRELRDRARAAGHVVVPVAPQDPAAPWLSVSKKAAAEEFRAAVKGLKKLAAAQAGDSSDFGAEGDPAESSRRPLALVLVHGYDPGTAFHEWFTSDFVGDRAEKKRLLVVVAGTALDTRPLKDVDGVALLELGPLRRADVLQWLRALDEQISDKLSAAEFEAYADAIAVQPERIAAFRRLLPLTSGGAR